MKIESYSFGHIVIQGKRYFRDVIVFPEKVRENWWRKEGHQLDIQDLEDVMEDKPEVLIVGTGYAGLLKVLPQTAEHLRRAGIELIAQRTTRAIKTYNQLLKEKKVVAALHLTC